MTRSHRQRLLSPAHLLVCTFWFAGAVFAAGLQFELGRLDRLAGQIGAETAAREIAAEFVAFAGSRENAERLVRGLTQPAPITLAADKGKSVTFSAPNPKLTLGEAYLALSLAQRRLAARGKTRPSLVDARDSLTGESGVLRLRSVGVEWEKIAALGKVGPDDLATPMGRLADAWQARTVAVAAPAAPAVVTPKPQVNTGQVLEKPERPERYDRPERPERPGGGGPAGCC